MGSGLGEFWRPNTLIGIFSLMNGHVWWPDSVMDLSLAEIPLLEVITSVFLMSRVNLGKIDHLAAQFDLSETFINEQVVFLMHGTVAALAGSAENFETSAQTKKWLVFCGLE